MAAACSSPPPSPEPQAGPGTDPTPPAALAATTPAGPSFAADAEFLREHAGGVVLRSGTGALVVSPPLQGRVMTSCVDLDGASLGFVNRTSILDPEAEVPFHNHGGEDRFWIGPEAGPFALYFPPRKPQVLEHWFVPADLDRGPMTVRYADNRSVVLERDLELRSVRGTTFRMHVLRTVEVLDREEVEAITGPLPEGTAWVAFRTRNRVENRGPDDWTREQGLPCIWILGMFLPGPDTWVVAPYRGPRVDDPAAPDFPVQTAYFGAVPPDRLKVGEGFVLFRADARRRSKIGLYPERARGVLGAYDPDRQVLTVVRGEPFRPELPYLNELWDPDNPEPWHGDVLNSYNHGGPETFFELETSSPALELVLGRAWEHVQTTVHLRLPDPDALAAAAGRALEVDWGRVARLAGWPRGR